MSKAPAGTPAKRALPSKEASLFKELLTLYETKQLKKGQKTADQILKKFPEHGGAYPTGPMELVVEITRVFRNTMHEGSRPDAHGTARRGHRLG